MIVILLEARIFELWDASNTIKSVFLDRPIDSQGTYFLSDINLIKNMENVYSVLVSRNFINTLYADNDTSGNLFKLPEFYKFLAIDWNRSNLHYVKSTNLMLGGSLLFKNFSFSGFNEDTITRIYSKIRKENRLLSSDDNSNETDYSESYPEDSIFKRYDDTNVAFLLPGEINSSVASYILHKCKPYLNDYSAYLNEVSITLYFFNPVSEVYLQTIFKYTKTLQGTLSFDYSVLGAFPLSYYSHQNSQNTRDFYLGVKLAFFALTICFFLNQFFTVKFLLVLIFRDFY